MVCLEAFFVSHFMEVVDLPEQGQVDRFLPPRTPSDISPELSILAVETNVFPLYEVEDGKKYTLNREPRHLPVQEYLMKQGRYRHLKEEQIKQIQMDVDEEWERLRQRATRSTSGDR